MARTEVTGIQVKNGTLLNVDIGSDAGIEISKFESLSSADIIIGSGSNIATAVSTSGDISLSNAGVFAIASGAILNGDVNGSAAIAGTKISADFGNQDLVVNTSALFVDVSANNVGIGTVSLSTDSRATGNLTLTASIFLGVLAGDPSSPGEGQIWYNSTDKQFKGYNGTAAVILG